MVKSIVLREPHTLEERTMDKIRFLMSDTGAEITALCREALEQKGVEVTVVEKDGMKVIFHTDTRDYETLFKLAQHSQKNRKIGDAIDYYEKYLKIAPNSDEKEEAKLQLSLLTTGEGLEQEEGFLDKLIGFFSKK